MEFKTHTLENGLTVIGEINHAAKSAATGLFVKAGSRDENDGIAGISFLVHSMVYKGNETLSPLAVNQSFDTIGAQFNSFVSEENTVYYAATLPEYVLEVTQLWIELMQPVFRREHLEIEKNVVKETLAMYRDQPKWDVIDKCRRLHFGKHPCGNSVLGSEDTIDDITLDQVKAYFADHYVTNNVVLVCAGDVDWESFLSVVGTRCRGWRPGSVMRKTNHIAGSGRVGRLRRAAIFSEHICLMSSGVSAQDPKRFAASLLGVIVGDDVGSRFFWELVDKALAEAGTMEFAAMDGTGVFSSYIRCNSKYVPKVLDTVRNIFNCLAKDGISKKELKIAKSKVVSALVIKNELPMGRLVDLGFTWTYLGQYRTIEEDVNAIKNVTVDDVQALIGQLNLGDFTQFSLGPERKS